MTELTSREGSLVIGKGQPTVLINDQLRVMDQDPEILEQLKITRSKRRSRVNYLDKEFRRIENLFQRGSSPESRRDSALEDLDQARLDLKAVGVEIAISQTRLKELQERKMALQIEIEKLERRKERINQEMRNNFAGSSQELAVKVQGFKDYLVGSLQDLVTAAEKLELARVEAPASRRREEQVRSRENLRRDDRDRGRKG